MPEDMRNDDFEGSHGYVSHAQCQYRHKEFIDAIGKIKDAQEDTNRRLFKDNGTLSIQTRLSQLDQTAAANKWMFGIILCAIVAVVITNIMVLR